MDDIYPIFEKYFSAAAQQVMKTKSDSFTYSYYTTAESDVESLKKLLKLLSLLNIESAQKVLETHNFRSLAFDRVHVLAIRCNRNDLQQGVVKLIKTVNDICNRGYSKASMVELGVIKFLPAPPEADQVQVMSYISLTTAGEQYVAATYPKIIVPEGQVAARLEEL